MNPPISVERLREYFTYNPDTGEIFWKRHHGKLPKDIVGKPAFWSMADRGYLVGKFDRTHLKAHRVAWALHTGAWPKDQIDHINGVKTDNRFANLRVVDHAGNGRNRRLSPKNTSGYNGVVRRHGSYTASVSVKGKYKYLGVFKTAEEAGEAARRAREEMGFHPNHGLPLDAARQALSRSKEK